MRECSTARRGSWAPFVLAQAVAAGALVRLEEAPAHLARTLPAEVRAWPFRWVFGDGSRAVGYTAVHRYARPGQYHLLVYGYYQRERRWFAFDSALVRVVRADQLLQANLQYDVLQVVLALSTFTWPPDEVLVCAVLILFLHIRKQHRGSAHGHP